MNQSTSSMMLLRIVLLLPVVALAFHPSSPTTTSSTHTSFKRSLLFGVVQTPLPVKPLYSLESSLLSPEETSVEERNSSDQSELFQELCETLGVAPSIRLDQSSPSTTGTTEEGESIRGVYLNHAVQEGEVIVSIPLLHCLSDDKPPQWFQTTDNDDESTSSYNPSEWATRLAANVLDRQLIAQADADAGQDKLDKSTSLWLDLLPNPDLLRATLPVHWSDEVLQTARCTALDLAIDNAFFARHKAVQDLLESLQNHPTATTTTGTTKSPSDLKRLVENALDVVQTRSCRVVLEQNGAPSGPPVRLVAPIFDFINHGGKALANAHFELQEMENDDNNDGDDEESLLYLTVVAQQDLQANDEILLDYGDSARSAWKCLVSYGFCPAFKQGCLDDDDEEHVAEVYLDGVRYEVGPTTIPQDLVTAMSDSSLEFGSSAAPAPSGDLSEMPSDTNVEFTPDIAVSLARRLSDVAFQLLLDDTASDTTTGTTTTSSAEGEESAAAAVLQSPEDVVSSKLAASLRWNQHRILLSCSMGLRDWAVGTDL